MHACSQWNCGSGIKFYKTKYAFVCCQRMEFQSEYRSQIRASDNRIHTEVLNRLRLDACLRNGDDGQVNCEVISVRILYTSALLFDVNSWTNFRFELISQTLHKCVFRRRRIVFYFTAAYTKWQDRKFIVNSFEKIAQLTPHCMCCDQLIKTYKQNTAPSGLHSLSSLQLKMSLNQS